ncbi:MAG: ATP phosphoribosyltransferase regulatory subunit [Clostridia bacterium]|nr:ATP phosphoribosyltransferase regulatory subunit [Clostridia bacterium]
MQINDNVLNYDEKIIFSLRSLYSKYGYAPYKMSKFEEYDLYVKNKDFLISDSVITFTDTNGKLMALKPDVTLSIIKNSKDACETVQKLYYNENVYRISKGTKVFKEIMQVGLECIGNIDNYCIFEVLMLAAQSLKNISADAILDISHLGVLSSIIDSFSVSYEMKQALMKCAAEKNLHEISAICADNGIEPEKAELLADIISFYGTPDEILPKLKDIPELSEAVEQLEAALAPFEGNELKEMLRIDFSVVSDMKYYNGIVFKGFINGIPNSVLSGGQYDKLMEKMNRKSGAVGFAVYLDMLERLENQKGEIF